MKETYRTSPEGAPEAGAQYHVYTC